jgi:hypothetical protein
MARNVDGMDEAMQRLKSNMAQLSGTSAAIEQRISPHRSEVDKLLGVSRLLKRLEFLFELPGRLKRSIELGACEQAVKYYRISSNILAQYAHLKSFDDIRRESEAIIDDLKQQLRRAVKDNPAAGSPAQASSGSTSGAAAALPISPELQMSYTAMLILDLGEPEPQAQELMRGLIEQHRRTFTQAMQRAVEAAAKQQASVRKGSVAERKAGEGDATPSTPSTVPTLLGLLHQYFLNPFVLFADTYLSTLVRPYETKLAKIQQQQQLDAASTPLNGNGASSEVSSSQSANAASVVSHLERSLALTRSSLVQLTQELFTQFFALARKELANAAAIGPSDDASRVILAFTGALKDFYASLARPVKLVPRAGLDDRATELMQHAILQCVVSVCDKVQQNVVETLDALHTQCADFDAATAAGTATSLPSPLSVSTQLRKHVEDGISLLVVVLSTREYLPENLPFPSFGDFAWLHVQQLLRAIQQLLSYRTSRRSEGPVHPFNPHSKLSRAILDKLAVPPASGGAPLSVTEQSNLAHTPLFYLYLSQIATAQESKDIGLTFRALRKFFPPSAGARGAPAKGSSTEAQVAELVSHTKEHAQMLLLRYCETHGYIVTEIVRTQLLQPAPAEAQHPSSFVDHLQEHLHRVSIELALIFPKAHADGEDMHGIGLLAHARLDSSSQRNLHSSASRGHAAGKDGKGSGGSGSVRGAGASGFNRDIQRLFTQKISTFGGVEPDGPVPSLAMDRTQPLGAICKIAFKAMMETVRMERLSANAVLQLQLDIFALRHELATCLPDADAELTRVLNVLLDETLNSALERTSHLTPADEYALSELYENSRAQRPSALVSPLSPRTAHPSSSDTDVNSHSAAAAAQPRRSTSNAAPPSALQADKPAGALARLVLSAPGSNVPAGSHMMSPTELLQQLRPSQNSATQ